MNASEIFCPYPCCSRFEVDDDLCNYWYWYHYFVLYYLFRYYYFVCRVFMVS